MVTQSVIKPFNVTTLFLIERDENDEAFVIHDQASVKRLVIFLVVLAGIVNACYGMFAPFLPLAMEKKGYSTDSMGAIIGIYSFTNICACLTAATFVKKFGRRKLMILNLIFLALSMLGLGFVMNFDLSETSFVVLVLFLRIIQGLTVGFLNTLRFSLLGFMVPLES